MATYAEYGPPPFVTLAAQAGFRPSSPRRAAARYEGQDLVNFLAAFPGAEPAAPPPPLA